MERVNARLDASGINDSSIVHSIYLCRNFGEFAYFVNRHYTVFGISHPVTDNIFINKSDAANNAIYSPIYQHHARTLEGVMTHEIVHVLLRKRYGLLTEQRMPQWKREGFPDYVCGETYFDYGEGVRLVKASALDDLSVLKSQPYFRYYLMVRYLIEVERLSVDEFVGREFDEKELERKVAASIKGR